MHDYKLIALDLDGTLLNSNKQLSVENAAALRLASSRGVQIVPTTGRFFDGMPQVIRALPYLNYAITINGAQVQDLHSGEIVYRAELPLPRALAILEYLDTLPVIYDCYCGNWGWMTRAMQEQAAQFISDPHSLKMVRELRTPVDELKSYLRARGEAVQKLQFFVKDPSCRPAVMAELERRFPGIAASTSLANNIELNDAAANKGDAVRALAAHLGLSMAQTISFGDGSNDLSMIRACGLGVAMANACPAVLAAADRVTASCDEDGIAAVIKSLF